MATFRQDTPRRLLAQRRELTIGGALRRHHQAERAAQAAPKPRPAVLAVMGIK